MKTNTTAGAQDWRKRTPKSREAGDML